MSEAAHRRSEELSAEVGSLRAAIKEREGEVGRLRADLDTATCLLATLVTWLHTNLTQLEAHLGIHGM